MTTPVEDDAPEGWIGIGLFMSAEEREHLRTLAAWSGIEEPYLINGFIRMMMRVVDLHRNNRQVVFTDPRRPGVMERFEEMFTRPGNRLTRPIPSRKQRRQWQQVKAESDRTREPVVGYVRPEVAARFDEFVLERRDGPAVATLAMYGLFIALRLMHGFRVEVTLVGAPQLVSLTEMLTADLRG